MIAMADSGPWSRGRECNPMPSSSTFLVHQLAGEGSGAERVDSGNYCPWVGYGPSLSSCGTSGVGASVGGISSDGSNS